MPDAMTHQSAAHYTAEAVALARAVGAHERDPAPRYPDVLAHYFLRPSFRAALLPGLRRVLEAAYSVAFPGTYLYLHGRMLWADAIAVAEARQGLEQLVILGAGYDTRFHRLREVLHGVDLYEVDHPATARHKAQCLREAGIEAGTVRRVAFDLNHGDLPRALQQAGLDPRKRTLFIAEGLLFYLPRLTVGKLLYGIAHHFGHAAIAFDFIDARALAIPDAFHGARQLLRQLQRKGEPVQFAIDPQDVDLWLHGLGFAQIARLDSAGLAVNFLMTRSGHPRGRVNEAFGLVLARNHP